MSGHVNENLLKNKKSLMQLVPVDHRCNGPLNVSHYNQTGIFAKNPQWYLVVIGLSENLGNSKKRAKKFNWDCNLDLVYLAQLWINQNGKCALTGQWLDHQSGWADDKNPYRTSIDRIDNSQGYVKGNVRLLTHWANNAKSTWTDKVFETFVKTSNQLLTENA
jgi:hypothetical protein